MIFVRRFRSVRIRKLVLEQKAFYEKPWTRNSILQWQLDKFNLQWKATAENVPYFRELKLKQRLPHTFSSWEEFKDKMPPMERQTIKGCRDELMNRAKPPDGWVSTGGSTAEPLQIPVWKSERGYAEKDLWYARSWFGVTPLDKLFLIWGHSHLLGKGWKGWRNGVERCLKDCLLGYHRFSAYDLSDRRLKEAAHALIKFRPNYLLGYAAALDRFARVNRDLQAQFRNLGLKVIIATAESFPKEDSYRLISEVFGSPVVMEYGSVETGPLAHERAPGDYFVFWRHYFLEGFPSPHVDGAYEVIVTSLYPRCLPLVRYKLGDLVYPDSDDGRMHRNFKSVLGRSNDFLILNGGSVVHSEAFSHAVKDSPSILNFQVIQPSNGNIQLHYLSNEPLPEKEIVEIRRRLHRIHPELEKVSIARVNALEQTIAGKTKRILSAINFQRDGSLLVNGAPVEISGYLEYHAMRIQKTLQKLKEIGAKRIVEVGGHPWVMTAYLMDGGFEVGATVSAEELTHWPDEIGVRTKPYEIETPAGKSVPFNNYSANIERTLFELREKPDTVVACEIVEHLKRSPHMMFLNINHWLPEGGKLFVTTPNGAQFFNPFHRKTVTPAYRSNVYERHTYLYTLDGLTDLIGLCGFRILEAGYWEVVKREGASRLYGVFSRLPWNYFQEKFKKTLFVVAQKDREVKELERCPRVYDPRGDWEYIRF